MLVTAILLSILIGISLGMLGGGGSILTVPILVYALGVEEKSAIASSLLIVAVTSAAAAVQHWRAGNVRWPIALIFSAAGMTGAFAGGRVAAYIPGWALIALFGVVMLVTGAAMWRKSNGNAAAENEKEGTPPAKLPILKIAVEGVIVGVVTGLVGAGGGFLVVPALALLGGLPMRQAVGTSLVVIALKSLAGFAGYATHVEIDLTLISYMSLAAVGGSFLGSAFGKRISQEKLRKSFAVFVLVMAVYLLYKQAGAMNPAAITTVLQMEWPAWVGGIALGLFVLAFLVLGGRMLGVSSGYMDACAAVKDKKSRSSWRLPFMAGILGGGVIAALSTGGFHPTFAMGMFDTILGLSLPLKALVFTGGGVLIGFGARLAGGCTSGHGIAGIAQMAPSSFISMGAFMVAGIAITNLLLRVVG